MSKEQSTITIHIVAKDAKAIAQSFMEWLDGQGEQDYWVAADAQEFDAGNKTHFDYDYAAQEITIRGTE